MDKLHCLGKHQTDLMKLKINFQEWSLEIKNLLKMEVTRVALRMSKDF